MHQFVHRSKTPHNQITITFQYKPVQAIYQHSPDHQNTVQTYQKSENQILLNLKTTFTHCIACLTFHTWSRDVQYFHPIYFSEKYLSFCPCSSTNSFSRTLYKRHSWFSKTKGRTAQPCLTTWAQHLILFRRQKYAAEYTIHYCSLPNLQQYLHQL